MNFFLQWVAFVSVVVVFVAMFAGQSKRVKCKFAIIQSGIEVGQDFLWRKRCKNHMVDGFYLKVIE